MPASTPVIVGRATWGANPLITPAGPIAMPSRELWLHHSAGEQFGFAGMRMLQAFTLHRTDTKYIDLEYTYVLDHATCAIFCSRGPGKNTAATGGRVKVLGLPLGKAHNDVSHAICVMGNFQTDIPSNALIEVLANLVAWGFEQGWWPLGFTGGHRDASGNSTACPGNHLEACIPTINARAIAIHNSGIAVPPGAYDASEEEQVIICPQPGVNGRSATARIVKAFGCVYLEDGARLVGDVPSGKNHTWIPTGLPPHSTIVGIGPTVYPKGHVEAGQPNGLGIVARYAFTNGDSGTYTGLFA